MSYYIGIDLGGTNIKAGIVNLEAGKVVAADSVPTLAREGHDAVMARMAGLIESSLTAHGTYISISPIKQPQFIVRTTTSSSHLKSCVQIKYESSCAVAWVDVYAEKSLTVQVSNSHVLFSG